MKLIAKKLYQDALKVIIEGCEWAFSFDRNVNLLHFSLMFDCLETAKELLKKNIDLNQRTSHIFTGEVVFNNLIVSGLIALDIAKIKSQNEIIHLIRSEQY